ncbi:hypothetical protein D3C87_2108530 [compost metagenome]
MNGQGRGSRSESFTARAASQRLAVMVVTKEAPMPSGTAGARSCANSLRSTSAGSAISLARTISRSRFSIIRDVAMR